MTCKETRRLQMVPDETGNVSVIFHYEDGWLHDYILGHRNRALTSNCAELILR